MMKSSGLNSAQKNILYSYKFTDCWLHIKIPAETPLSETQCILDEIHRERPKTRKIKSLTIERVTRVAPHPNQCWYCGNHEPFQQKWSNGSGEKWLCHRHSTMVRTSLILRELGQYEDANKLDSVVGIETDPDLCVWIEILEPIVEVMR